MSKKARRVRNWSQYNKSLIKRGDLTFWFSQDLLDNWASEPGKKSHGNQKYSEIVITCALTLRQLYNQPLRGTQGFMQSLLQLIGAANEAPHYSTLCRRAKNLPILLNPKPSKKPAHVLVDSTGIRVFGESEWKFVKYRIEKTKYQKWRKLHIAIDANTQDILAATITDSSFQDGNCLPDLINQIDRKIGQITADGAYDKLACYKKAYEVGATPVFPPQHNASVQANKYKKNPALVARDQTILSIGRGADRVERLRAWKVKNNYHRRSLVETAMFRMKSIFGWQVRSKCFKNQVTDLLIRCRAINKMNTLDLPLSEPI